jgi:hypothetical protein
MFFDRRFPRLAGSGRGAFRRPVARADAFPVERLEGRTLLSSGAHAVSHALARHATAVEVAAFVGPRHPISDHNPLRESVVKGLVRKKFPHFYEKYDGPRLPDLSGRQASAHLVPGQGFVFTGTMAGPIDPAVTKSYVFAINRGGAVAPGPFPNRAMIFFDATVAVTTGPAATTGVVTLYRADGDNPTIVLPAQAISVSGSTVRVTVDPALLPPTSTPQTRLKLTEYRFTLWTALGAFPGGKVADFVPEYSQAPFAIPKR